MMDYKELAKCLRDAAWKYGNYGTKNGGLLQEAADAIEKLSKVADTVNDAHNEGYDVGYWAGRRDYEPKWIPVTERLPIGGDDSGAICENVCLLMDDGTVSCGWMNGITKKVYYLNAIDDVIIKAPITRVTHWMPLPTPAEEKR